MYPPGSLPTYGPKEAILNLLRFSGFGSVESKPMIETVQFTTSRNIPGHQLQDITFQNSKGQEEEFRFLLCQWRNKTWHIVEYSGGPRTTRSSRSKNPVKSKRPWLALAGSTAISQAGAFPGGEELMQEVEKIVTALMASGDREKTKTFYTVLEEKLHSGQEEEKIREVKTFLHEFQHTLPELQGTEEEQLGPFNHFLAHGTVTDNGFNIVRVRLISSNGFVFEDIPQDGLVFFASHRKVIRPLQAELYNPSGQVVSRQTVLAPVSFPPDAQLDGMFRNQLE